MPKQVATEGNVNEAPVEGASVEETVNKTAATEQPKKRRGRGISNETRTISRLKFSERDANRVNHLFLGVVESVQVQWVTIDASKTGLPSFAGLSIPVFSVVFTSCHNDANEKRYVSLRLMPAESNAETIPGAKGEWKVNNVLAYIKHLLDVFYLKGRALSEKEEDALTLTFEDFVEDEQGNIVYEPVEAEEVIAGYRHVFENAAAMLNGEFNLAEGAAPKPAFKDAAGKPIVVWMKLLRFTKVKNTWRPVVGGTSTLGDLGFTTFLGEGVIEVYKEQKVPNLRVDPIKESITPKEMAKAPMNPAMPGVGGVAPMMPGMPAGAPMGGAGTAPDFDYGAMGDGVTGFGDDLPF